jgi:hypothetical protein
VSAPVVDFGDLVFLARGEAGEAERQRTIAIRRQAAFRRAVHDAGGLRPLEYSLADQALFGSVRQLLDEGPGEDPRLQGEG